jgi:hypothetical protein
VYFLSGSGSGFGFGFFFSGTIILLLRATHPGLLLQFAMRLL